MFMTFASFTYYPPPLLEQIQNHVPASATSLEPSYHRPVHRQDAPKPHRPSLRRRSIKSLTDLRNRVIRPAASMPALRNPFGHSPRPSSPGDETLVVTGPEVTGPPESAACARTKPASCSPSAGDTNTRALIPAAPATERTSDSTSGTLRATSRASRASRASSDGEREVDATEGLLPLDEADEEHEQRSNHRDINRNLNREQRAEDINSAPSVAARLARKLSMTIPVRFSARATEDTPDERTRLPHRLRKAMSFSSQAIAIPQGPSEPEEMVMTPTNESSEASQSQSQTPSAAHGYATLVNPPPLLAELGEQTRSDSAGAHDEPHINNSEPHDNNFEPHINAAEPHGVEPHNEPHDVEPHRAAADDAAAAAADDPPTGDPQHPYSIRLTPFVDHSTTMPGFYIGPVERKARNGTLIRVGRYTDRKDADAAAGDNESTPIVFKSKVVSRSHAEFFVEKGQWYVRDVKSSSGTFLNHMRLSPAGQPSEPHALSDGDVLQFGMDYRGGSEELYKCVKVHLELNQSWKKKVNQFNVHALDSLKDMVASRDLQECAICLLPVSPLQALFIAPCSHAWHYKCIRPLIIKPYPHFLCPNCRTVCDLEADIEVPDLSHLDLEDPPTNDD